MEHQGGVGGVEVGGEGESGRGGRWWSTQAAERALGVTNGCGAPEMLIPHPNPGDSPRVQL